jgi:glycosyltransferase involved in cell wall biosynthesis
MWTSLPFVFCGLPLRAMHRNCVFMVTGLGSVFGTGDRLPWIVRPVADRIFPYLFGGEESRVIVHNAEDKEYLSSRFGVPRECIQVTPGCGVDPEQYPWIEEFPQGPRPVIYAPVRLIHEKGVQEAVEASALLLARGIDHELWFTSAIDEGNPVSLSQADLDRLKGLSGAVRFLGYQPSVMDVYRKCDIVCMPTQYREGLPTALLEAASCGRPIVATNNVGCREFVSNERTGLMVPRGDSEALAGALARLIADRALAEGLRRRARQRFLEGFTKRVMVARTLELMESFSGAKPQEVEPPIRRAAG